MFNTNVTAVTGNSPIPVCRSERLPVSHSLSLYRSADPRFPKRYFSVSVSFMLIRRKQIGIIAGFFWIGKFWQVFFWAAFLCNQNNLKFRDSYIIKRFLEICLFYLPDTCIAKQCLLLSNQLANNGKLSLMLSFHEIMKLHCSARILVGPKLVNSKLPINYFIVICK